MIGANMNQIFEYLIRPYQDLDILEVILEIFAVILGLTSVWFAKKDKVLVYPTGMLSTSIFVYLLFILKIIKKPIKFLKALNMS